MAEMSREDAINSLKEKCLECGYGFDFDECDVSFCDYKTGVNKAISDMEKLEKIENIMNDCFCSQGICLRRCKYIDIADIDNCVAVRRYDEIGKILRGD